MGTSLVEYWGNIGGILTSNIPLIDTRAPSGGILVEYWPVQYSTMATILEKNLGQIPLCIFKSDILEIRF